MSDSSTPDEVSQILAQIAHELGRRGPHPRLLKQLLHVMTRLPDPRFERELLLLLSELPVQPLEPAVSAQLRSCLISLLPGLRSSLQPYVLWLTALLPAQTDLPELFADPLFELMMTRAYLMNVSLEELLSDLRRELLLQGPQSGEDLYLPLLATQAQLNGFVWAESPPETEALAALEALKGLGSLSERESRLLACYRPQQPQAGPTAEIQTLTDIPEQDPCHLFYSESPYPRWLAPERLAVEPLNEQLETLFGQHSSETAQWPLPERVLVAGCGTGQQVAQLALQLPEAQITALDLSRPALEYAALRLREQALHAELFQADLLQLGNWEQRFELIACGGVLHHLTDPEAGLQTLSHLLTPDGLIKLGIYSRRARMPVESLRQAYGITGTETPEQVRALRTRLLNDDSEAARWLRNTHDFYTLETCRDLLFHPREQAFSLPEIMPWLRRCGLELIGPELWQPGDYALFRELFPGRPYSDAQAWDQLEAQHPALFAGLMVLWLRPAQTSQAPPEPHLTQDQRDDKWIQASYWL